MSTHPHHEGVYSPLHLIASDLKTPKLDWRERAAAGRGLRKRLPRSGLGDWQPGKKRFDPVGLLQAGNAGRDLELIPLRMSRMASSPFAFLRGSAAVMAADLAGQPSSGLHVMLDGDAHFNNFGLFGTPDAQVVVDLNDFDEVMVGPWEWDLKRLTASIEVAGREIGLDAPSREHAVRGASAGYRSAMGLMAGVPVLALWQRRTTVEDLIGDLSAQVRGSWAADEGARNLLESAKKKALQSNNDSLRASMTQTDASGARVFLEQPPILTRPDAAVRDQVISALEAYLHSLPLERHFMMRRYRVADVSHRVVGVGSVGLRAYCVMLTGNDDSDSLFLQVKQAAPAAHAPFAPSLPEPFNHEGQRVVHGQRLMQSLGDPMLGWTSIDGQPYYVRQMRNLKGSFAPEKMSATTFSALSWTFGSLLARAHARTGDAAAISGYCGASSHEDHELDDAMFTWAKAYADQTEADHARLVASLG